MTDFKRIIKRALCVCLAAVIAVSVTVGGIGVASAATYDPSAAVAYAAAHWNDGKGECAEFVRDCLRAGGLTSLTSINTSGLMNQIINAGYGERYRLVESSDGKFLMSDNSAILAPGDPIIFYCATCGFYPHLLLCGTGSGGYVTYYAHNNAANNKVLWANVGGSHKYHNNYAFSIHMKNNGYYPVDEYEYATYTVSNAEGSDLRNRPYKEYGYEDTSVSAVDFGAEVVIIGFYENENGVTYARTESGYWIYATDLEKKEDLVSLSISGETKPTAIEEGSSFGLKGTVTSKSSNISALTAGVYTPDGAVVTEKTVDPASTVASMSLVDAYIAFGKLSVGSYVYKVTAKNAISEATLVDQPFTVYKNGEVTVTFDANGGQCDTTSLDITSGETVSALPTPIREGFDFLGWFDENGGELTAETAVTADITVTAKWTSESSGGETDPTAAFSLSSDVNYPPKYHIANTSYKLYGTITSLCGNMTTVKGGIFDTDGKMVYGTTVSVNATTFNISQIDNYIAFRNLGVGKYYYRITATNDCGTYDVINYFFNAVTEVPTFFTVTFDANGGQCDTTSLEIISGETVSALPTPVREGFDFLGWFDENGGDFTAETAVTADITVTAKWEVAQPPLDDLSWEIESYLYARYRGRRVSLHNVPYTLYHDYETEVALLNGEVVVIGRTTNYYGEKWLLTEEGDWVKESDVTKIEDLMPFILSDDVNYPEKLHLSYTSCKLYGTVTSLSGDIKTVNGGIFDADGNRVYGTTVTVDAPTFNISKIDDYIAFRSLGAGEYYYRVIAENNCGTYNVINYAFTVVDEYPAEVTITFKDESLSNVSSELTVARGNTVDELPTPTKSGYIFEGWVDEDGKVITAATAVTYNMTAIPVWVRRIGDVNFDDATDAADVILLEQFILGLIDESEIPDVNGDGIVDSADTVVIQMAVLGFN